MESKEPISPNIIGYHANTAERCDRFLSGDYEALKSIEDGEWLGSGIYFWDNLSNAKYWQKEKKRKLAGEKIKIIQAQFKIDRLLDLTDISVCQSMEKVWKCIADKLGASSDAPLGKKLNVLFENVLKDYYDVIRIYGKYPKSVETAFYSFSMHSKRIEPVNYVKCIYALRNKDAILNHSEVEL